MLGGFGGVGTGQQDLDGNLAARGVLEGLEDGTLPAFGNLLDEGVAFDGGKGDGGFDGAVGHGGRGGVFQKRAGLLVGVQQ